MKHWNLDIIDYCQIEKDLELSSSLPNCSKIPWSYCPCLYLPMAEVWSLNELSKDIFKNGAKILYCYSSWGRKYAKSCDGLKWKYLSISRREHNFSAKQKNCYLVLQMIHFEQLSFVSEVTFEDSFVTMKRRKTVSDIMITKKPFIESVKVLERCKL